MYISNVSGVNEEYLVRKFVTSRIGEDAVSHDNVHVPAIFFVDKSAKKKRYLHKIFKIRSESRLTHRLARQCRISRLRCADRPSFFRLRQLSIEQRDYCRKRIFLASRHNFQTTFRRRRSCLLVARNTVRVNQK